MNEQLFLNGAPVVGFGDEFSDQTERDTKALGVWMLLTGVGVIGGGVIGYNQGKVLGGVGGVVVGGVVGGLTGRAIGVAIAKKPSTTQTGVGTVPVTAAAGLPWGEFVASGVVSALAGLAVEEAVRAVRKRR